MNLNAEPTDRFFAIALSDWIGITDKLWQLSKLHRLGRALSYDYVHTPFHCVRSSSSSYWQMALLRVSRKLAALSNVQKYQSDDIGKFLGLERRQRNINDPVFRNYRKTEILLDDIFQNKEFGSLAEVKEIVDSIDQNKETIKVFTTQQGIYSYVDQIDRLLSDCKEDYFKELEIAKHYWLARSKNSIDSQFLPNKIKVLVHIRNGDMASFKIGNKVLSVFARSVCIAESEDALERSRNAAALQKFTKPIALQEYVHLLEAIFQMAAQDIFSVVVISDGYGRALEVIFRALRKGEIALTPLEVLKLLQEIYRSQQQLKSFFSIHNASTIVGESKQNLFRSIHAIAEADIVIKSSGSFASLIHQFFKKEDQSTVFLNVHLYREKDLAAVGELIRIRASQFS